MMRFPIPTVALFVVLVSCASSPNLSYHTLDMTTSGGAEPGVNLVVDRFHVSEMLDRTQIVIHHTSTRIEYYATDRWASGIGELVQQKLMAEFGPAVDGRRTFKVSGQVGAFEQVDGVGGPVGRVKLAVTVRDVADKRYEPPLIEKTYEANRTANGEDVDAVVRALSRAMEEIAAAIAADSAKL